MLGLVRAQVTAHDPPWGVRVAFRTTGQQISYRCYMSYDYATALTASQRPLPQIGSWGLVCPVDDDLRSMVWIRAIVPSQQDALTTTMASGSAPTDPHIDYQAHFSGDWHMLDGLGNYSRQWADGSYFTVGSGTTLPTVYRHTVDSTGTQQTIPFTRADRIPNPPSPSAYHYQHVTGTNFTIDVSGNVSVSGVPVSGTMTMQFQDLSITIYGQGTINIAGTASGESINLNLDRSQPTEIRPLSTIRL